MVKKWLKLKESRKLHISGIRGPRTKRQVKTPWTVPSESPLVIFDSF